jgi:hypothetical protein
MLLDHKKKGEMSLSSSNVNKKTFLLESKEWQDDKAGKHVYVQ